MGNCDHQRCAQRAPASVAYFEYNGKSVSLRANPGHKVNVNDKLVEFALLQPDTAETPSFITLDDIRLVVIQRGNRLGIRMWDNQREERRSFPARTWFEISARAFNSPRVVSK